MTNGGNTIGGDPGLQPERTSLSWTRTSLAVVLTGALLFAKDLERFGDPRWLIGVVASVCVAGLVLAVGLRRKHTLMKPGEVPSATPRREIYLTGISVLILILAMIFSLAP